MDHLATIELAKEYLKFSAAHFTIFSEKDRERLHGHNFSVSASFTCKVDDNGLCFSYAELKSTLRELCNELDEFLLLPEKSPHLDISIQDNNYHVIFNGEDMFFLKKDTLLLPLRNISVEELAGYLLDRIIKDNQISKYQIQAIELKVSSGPGQWGVKNWTRPNNTATNA